MRSVASANDFVVLHISFLGRRFHASDSTLRDEPSCAERAEKHGIRYKSRYSGSFASIAGARKLLKNLEARVGIEPTHKGFADLSLTAWVPRLEQVILIQAGMEKPASAIK